MGETHLVGSKGLILIGPWLLAKVCLKSRWATRIERNLNRNEYLLLACYTHTSLRGGNKRTGSPGGTRSQLVEKPEYHEGFILSHGRRVLVRQRNHGIIMSHMLKSGFKTVTPIVSGIWSGEGREGEASGSLQQ